VADQDAEWADAPADFSAIPLPFKEKNLKKVMFKGNTDDGEIKKDNKEWKRE